MSRVSKAGRYTEEIEKIKAQKIIVRRGREAWIKSKS